MSITWRPESLLPWFLVVCKESGHRGRRGSTEVVEVLPFLEVLVEGTGVVDDDALEEPVELFLVDAVRSFHLSVQTRCGRADVEVADPAVEQVPMEGPLKLGPIEFLRHVKPLSRS